MIEPLSPTHTTTLEQALHTARALIAGAHIAAEQQAAAAAVIAEIDRALASLASRAEPAVPVPRVRSTRPRETPARPPRAVKPDARRERSRVAGDKREYPRCRAALVVRYEFAGEVVEARTRDLSVGGVFVETERPAPYGTCLRLEIQFPLLPEPVAIEATVRWTSRDGMGLQFAALRARATWAIHRLMAAAPTGPEPAAGPRSGLDPILRNSQRGV